MATYAGVARAGRQSWFRPRPLQALDIWSPISRVAQGGYISPGGVLENATLGGARAMGWQNRIGSLEPGKRAHLVRNDLPEPCPGTDPVFETVLVAHSKSVDTVICDGQVIVRGGHSTRLDERVVYASACASARRLMAKTGLKEDSDWPTVSAADILGDQRRLKRVWPGSPLRTPWLPDSDRVGRAGRMKTGPVNAGSCL
ncbi:amidohydrolase family protein [Bradyrhizobium sp. CCBAU 51745]|uniref:amidohydrolase family protein n=1 Tax=Bradyrhizobium sp. CCBAU 51745 TaxID=1325099 RepID=UPI003FA496CF